MYARFDRLARELSSDEGSDDDNAAAGAAAQRGRPAPAWRGGDGARQAGVDAAARGAGAGAEAPAGAAFQRIKAHCVGLLGACDAAGRDAALQGIAAEFGALERHTAAGLAKFALLPLLLLLRDADAQGPGSAASGPPMAVRKERGIELALAAMSAVVRAGGVAGEEALDVLTAAARMLHKPAPAGTAGAGPREGGPAPTGGVELRASEVVVCAAVDAIMLVLRDLRRQESESSGAECSLSQAWQDKSAALGHVLASLLAVGKAGDSVPAATRQQAVEAVELMFRVIHGPPQRAAFYVPGVVSAMARILVTSTSKGTRSRLGAAALSCWRHVSSRFLADELVQDEAEDLVRDLDAEHASTLPPTSGRAGASEVTSGATGDVHKSLGLLRAMAAEAGSAGGENNCKGGEGAGGSAAAQVPGSDAQRSARAMLPGGVSKKHSAGAKTGSEGASDGLTVALDASWRATVASNYLTLLNRALPAALTHPALVIRRGALDLVSVLLLQCTETLGVCVPALLHALAALCADSAEDVAQAALALVSDWAKRGRLDQAVSTSLEAVLALLLSLPVTFRCEADQGVKRLAIQHLWGHMRLLQAAGALDRLLDSKIHNVLGALLQCMRMPCDQVPAVVEHDPHPAALRYTAPAAAQQGGLPQHQPATRPGNAASEWAQTASESAGARQSAGQRVRQRLRQVATACQRPLANASSAPVTAPVTPQTPRDAGPPPQVHARQMASGAACRQAEEERETTPVSLRTASGMSQTYIHKRFDFFTGGDMEGVLCQVVSFIALHHGLYRTIKALSQYACKSGQDARSAPALRGPALYLINCTLLSSMCRGSSASKLAATTSAGGDGRGGGHDDSSPFAASALAHGMGDGGAEDALPALWSDEQELGLGPLVLTGLPPQPSSALPLPPLLLEPDTAPSAAARARTAADAVSASAPVAQGRSVRDMREAVASVDHVLDCYLDLCLPREEAQLWAARAVDGDGASMHCFWRCLALQGLGDFAQALGAAFEPKLLRAAFPLLAAAASTNATVCDTAMATLERVCAACGYGSLSEMVQCNSDYLVDAICRSLTRGAQPLQRPRPRLNSRSSCAPDGRRGKSAAPVPTPAVQAAELQLGVDVLHVLLAHVGAEKGSLLADSLQAVLALLDLHPSPHASAALASTLAAFVAAVSDAAAHGAWHTKDEAAASSGHRGNCHALAHGLHVSPVGDVGDSAPDTPPPCSHAGNGRRGEGLACGDEEVEEKGADLDIAELQLAMDCAANDDDGGRSAGSRRCEASSVSPTATGSETLASLLQHDTSPAPSPQAPEAERERDGEQSKGCEAEGGGAREAEGGAAGGASDSGIGAAPDLGARQAARAQDMIELILRAAHSLLSHQVYAQRPPYAAPHVAHEPRLGACSAPQARAHWLLPRRLRAQRCRQHTLPPRAPGLTLRVAYHPNTHTHTLLTSTSIG